MSADIETEIVKEIPPSYPHENLETTDLNYRDKILCLVHGYIRSNYSFADAYKGGQIPIEIIQLFFKWYYTQKYAITYEDTLNLLLNYDCCVGIYDFHFPYLEISYLYKSFSKNKKHHGLLYTSNARHCNAHTDQTFSSQLCCL